MDIEAVVAQANSARTDGTIFDADSLRQLADGVRLFWDEATKSLLYRGPASELRYMPAGDEKAWDDSEVYSASSFKTEHLLGFSGADARGLNAEPPPNWDDFEFVWTVGADNVWRLVASAALTSVHGPQRSK